jgi:hypothetical protein
MIKDGVRNSNSIGRAAEEFAGAQLGDERRTKRLIKIATAVERDPAISFSESNAIGRRAGGVLSIHQ